MKKEKEFKRLNRAELVEIIYQLQLDNKRLTEEKAAIQNKLDSKEIRISQAGSIAEATVAISDIFFKAQEVADHYLSEVKRSNAELEQECETRISQAQSRADVIIRDAEHRARQIVEAAEKESLKKWQTVNERVKQLIESRDALKDFLNK